MATDKKYRIVCLCDPHNARYYYGGIGEVLKSDNGTPVKWVHWDNFRQGATLDEAKKTLVNVGRLWFDISNYYDAERIDDLVYVIAEDMEISQDEARKLVDWYSVPGFYIDNVLQFAEGETSFTYDCLTYRIEEMN
jgi:hypothetical protein